MVKVFKPALKDRHKRLLEMIKASRMRLLLAMLCMFVMAVCTAASAYLIKPAIDDIFIEKDLGMLRLIPLAVILIYILRGLSMYGQNYFMNHVGQGIIRQLRNLLYDRIQELPLAFFHEQKTGTLMSRITNDVNIIRDMVSHAVTSALKDCFTIVGLMAVIFYRDWKLAAIALFILPAAFYPVVALGRRVRRVSTGCQESMADMNVFLHETFSGTKIVKAFGMEAFEKKRFREKTQNLFKLEMRAVIARSLSSPIMEFLAGVGIAFIIWYGGYRVINGTSTTGTFFSFLAAVLMLYEPVKKISRLNNRIQEGLAAADRVFDIIEQESNIIEPERPVALEGGSHAVTFENVSFQYDENENRVLKEINLSVRSGEILALVGMSGGGKTSLVNLIPRFYDVTRGALCIDGVDVRDVATHALRRQIAIVTQEPILFNDTVYNNIAYGNPGAGEERIVDAAKLAYAHDFIRGFPHGYNTVIGELGERLSGGEKQRICIARALIKDAPILILDEATSSLDTESEMLVQKALENLMQGRTTFVIAHRLSTVAYANRIVVLVNGEIVEEGQHDALLEKKGAYHKLHQMQYRNNDKQKA